MNSSMNIHSEIARKKSGKLINVLLFSTMVPIIGVTRDTRKPAIIELYNNTMGGTDVVDLLIVHKTVRWKSNKWTMSPLAFMLDTAAVNANTISGLHEGRTKPDTRAFRYELIADLVIPHIRRRLTNRNIQRPIRAKAEAYLGKLLCTVKDPIPLNSVLNQDYVGP